MVGDHELGLGRPALRGLREAGGEEGAAPPRAAVGPHRELGPERFRGLQLELGAVAGLGRRQPGLHRLERLLVAGIAEQHRPEALQLLAAEVVLASLQHGDADFAPERPRGGRHLLGEELLLERLRRRRDDHPLARLEGGQEIGEALAGARAGLGDQVLARRERALDRRRKGRLLGSRLETGQGGGERAAGAEGFVHSAAQATEANGCSLGR